MKIVLNKCYGGFSVTKAVYDRLGLKWENFGYLDNESFGIESNDYLAYRQHPKLIDAIERIGLENSSGDSADLNIVEIPDGIEFDIEDYNGIETVHERHKTW